MSTVNTLPGSSSHFINLEEAITMTSAYRSNSESLLDTAYQNEGILPLNETFNRNALDALLAQSGCEAIRIYYGLDSNSKIHAIMVGVTEDNEDILPSTLNSLSTEEDVIVELSQRCPDMCPPASPLNS